MAVSRSDVESVAIGAGSYYLISGIFTFYPAFIITLQLLQSMFRGRETSTEEVLTGLIVMLGCSLTIWILTLCRQYFIVAMAYILTLWPMIHQIYMYGVNLDNGPGGTNTCFPLPPVDWCIFF